MPFPRGTPVYFGSGEEPGEEFLFETAEPGDIFPGVYDPVPSARKEWHDLDIGEMIPEITLRDPNDGTIQKVQGTHYGYGIALLDRDRVRIRRLLHRDLSTVEQKISPHTLNACLRGFFPGRSYVRLYSLGGSRGTRKSKEPFLWCRLHAITRKFENSFL